MRKRPFFRALACLFMLLTVCSSQNSAIAGMRHFDDSNGGFSIMEKEGAVLKISFIVFEKKDVLVLSGKEMLIFLNRQEAVAMKVAVTALGIKKEKYKTSYAKQELIGAAIAKAPEVNIAGNLTGKVAGLNMLIKSNLFGNPKILFRGETTLVVIDGVPTSKDNYDFWNLNSNNSENVNVLKGTAAAALHGSIGINGAIMIATQKEREIRGRRGRSNL